MKNIYAKIMSCKNLEKRDVTPYRGDVFDHPEYKFFCQKDGKEIIPQISCVDCKEYAPSCYEISK